MKGWAVVAVVALQAVAQTTAMTLLSGGSTGELAYVQEMDSSQSRRFSEDGTAASAKAKNRESRTDGWSSSMGIQEDNTITKEKVAREEGSVECHMGKGGNDCLVKRKVGDEVPISKMVSEAIMSAMIKRTNEEVALILNRKRREPEETSVEDKNSPIMIEETKALARINSNCAGGSGGGGGHQPPMEPPSRNVRDTGESAVNSNAVEEVKSSNLAKKMEEVKSASMARTATEMSGEDQPLAESRGLLSGLLGGGGSGGNCTAQGDTGDITETDKQLARAAWALAGKDYYGLGKTLFTELFTKNPDYVKYFRQMKSSPEQDLFESPRFKKHMVSALFPAVAEMLANLDHPEKLHDQLKKVAINHKRRHLARHHFEAIQQVIIVAMKKTLGSEFSTKTEAAFDKILTVAFNGISVIIETC